MARGRMLDKRIAKSDKLASLKRDRSRVLYFMIYPHLDVDGRFSGNPKDIKEDCCPRLSYSLRQISESIIDLNNVGLLNLYEVESSPYIEYTRFDDFQTLRKDREEKSKIQAYSSLTPEDAGRTPAIYLSLSLSKGRKEGNKNNNIYFDFSQKKFFNILREDIERWKKIYPACNIELCILQSGEWLLADPKRKKSNYHRFITNWLKREQDSGGTKTGKKTESLDDYKERQQRALYGNKEYEERKRDGRLPK